MKKIKYIIVALVGLLFAGIYSFRTWPVEIYDSNIDSTLYENVGELIEGSKVEQTFLCSQNGLHAIELKVSNLGQECEGRYSWKLEETQSGKIAAQGQLEAEAIDNSRNSVLEFAKIDDSKGKEYLLTIQTEQIDSEHGITLMKTEKNSKEDGKLSVNGEESEQVLVLKEQIHYFNVETFVVLLGLIAYLVFFIRFLTRIFK